jgi:tetratricopeptide (TPR) repeat protein
MKKLSFVAVVVTVISGGVFAYSLLRVSNKTPQAYFESGKKYYDQGKFAEATIEFLNAVKRDPNYRNGRYYLALSYFGQHDVVSAVKQLRAIIEAHPDDIEANLRLGTIYMTAGAVNPDLYHRAKEIAQEVLSRQPQNVAGLLLSADASAGMKDFDTSVELYLKVLALDPQNVNAFIGIGTSQALQKKFPEAEKAFLKAREANPKSKSALTSLASFYRVRDNPTRAEAVLKEALSQYPTDSGIYLQAADFYLQLGLFDEIEKVLRAAQAASGSDLTPTLTLADIYQGQNRVEDARKLLLEAKQKFPNNIQLSIKVAENLMPDKRDQAKQEIDQILKAEPKNAAGNALLGWFQYNSGNFDAAQEILGKEPVLGSPLPLPHYLLGNMALQKGKIDEARDHYQKSVTVKKDYIPGRVALADVYMLQGKVADAGVEVQKVLEVDPRNMLARLAKARIDVANKNYSAAEPELANLVKEFPDNAAIQREMGLYYSSRGKSVEAEKNLVRALELSPTEQSFQDLIVFYLQTKQADRALQKINSVPDAQKQAFQYELMGMIAEQAGKPQDSEAAYKKAFEKDPNRLSSVSLLVDQYLRSGRLDDAVKQLDGLSKKLPKAGILPAMKGAVEERQGNSKEAEENYRQALQLDPTNDLAANNLAYLLAQDGRDLQTALELAQGVRRRQPQNPQGADTLGWVFYKLDRLVLAKDQLQFAVTTQPENATFQYHLGEIYRKDNRNSDAVRALRKAVDSKSDFKERSLAQAALKVALKQ